ncbi:MAG: insulinase family protein, partial [Eubacterium sp.]|nr:insulinase family protein [Eubacterium sp.]
MDINKIPAYELITREEIEEVDSTAYLLQHKKTRARIVVLENEDDNKVFDIGFRTPPTDSTGVPHIIEHTVLCGSKKFPVKDPFAEMDKGSLNTFLNAMTYPDKTVYPVASVNDKDFRNLMDVYLDAVFFPNIYKEEKIFRQEGWHYEMEDVDGELTYNGVVFNEMKGAFSSPDEHFEKLIQETLFPDTTYGVVSGGDPVVIPDLKWEDYLDFHRRYYHPSNSYIYIYGKVDFEDKLNWIDEEYLSKFDYLEVDSVVREQKPFGEMREAEGFYPIPAGEDTEGKTYLAYAGVCGTTLDANLYQAFQVLEYALVEAVGAPVKEALVKAGIGTEIDGSYNEPFLQPFFSISAKNARDDQRGDFIKTVRDTLTDLAENGINKRSLKAALNAMEFQFREADFGRFPKGLMYGLGIYDSWLYDDRKPFIHLHLNETFRFLREQIETDYFENLIRTYLLDNPHSAFVTLRPKPGMTTEIEEAEKKRLQDHLDLLSAEEKEAIIRETKELKRYQEEPSTPEEMATIPMLGREDIGKKSRPIKYEERQVDGNKTIFNDVFTNGISYIKFSFDISDLEPYAHYIGLMADVLGAMDTDTHDKLELSNELLLHAGGYNVVTTSYVNEKTEENCQRIELGTKVLFDETQTMMGLLDEIVQQTHLSDTERLKEIIAERRSSRQAALPSAGHNTAINRALAYFRESARWGEELKGLSYYDFLCEVDDHFDDYKDNLVEVLTWLRDVIFTRDRLLI